MRKSLGLNLIQANLFRDKVNLQLMNLLEEPDRDHEPSHLKLLKKVYKSCMNTKQIETEGLTFVKNGFKDLGGWPVVEPYWNDKIFDWKSLLYRIQKSEWRESFFFSMYVGTDYKDSSKVIFTVSIYFLVYRVVLVAIYRLPNLLCIMKH